MPSEGKASTSSTARGASSRVSPPALKAPACSPSEGGKSLSPDADTKMTVISQMYRHWAEGTYCESHPARG
jgi:hypothetical protein